MNVFQNAHIPRTNQKLSILKTNATCTDQNDKVEKSQNFNVKLHIKLYKTS